MNLELHVRIVGILLLALAASHVVFPKRFHWREELARLSLLNRQIFVVHCLFIVLLLVLLGVLTLGYAETLPTPSALARIVLAGLAVFWGMRLVAQWCIYDWRLWRGKRLETTVHIVFTGMWCYMAGVFAIAWWQQP